MTTKSTYQRFLDQFSLLLRITGFSVLATFCGVGIAWIAVGTLANLFKDQGDRIVTGSMPVLILGGVLGLVAGIIVSVRVARAKLKTRRKIDRSYIGRGGRVRIYFGAPLLLMGTAVPLLDLLSRHFGNQIAIYGYFGLCLAIVAASLFLYDRIPARFIIPIGITGWLLLVLSAFGFSLYMMHRPMSW